MKLNRGHIPLYYQLQKILREKISSGQIGPQEALPTENDLCENYGVSRTTVRQAFNALINDGLIVRIPGKGTFLSERNTQQRTMHYFNTTESLVELPHFEKYENRIHYRGVVLPSEKIISLLKLTHGEKIYCIRGVRVFEDRPLAYFVTSMPSEYAGLLSGERLKAGALLTILEKKLGLVVQKVFQTLSAKLADERTAKFLGIQKKDPLLVLERVYYVEEDRPIEVGINYFNSENYQYAMELTHKI